MYGNQDELTDPYFSGTIRRDRRRRATGNREIYVTHNEQGRVKRYGYLGALAVFELEDASRRVKNVIYRMIEDGELQRGYSKDDPRIKQLKAEEALRKKYHQMKQLVDKLQKLSPECVVNYLVNLRTDELLSIHHKNLSNDDEIKSVIDLLARYIEQTNNQEVNSRAKELIIKFLNGKAKGTEVKVAIALMRSLEDRLHPIRTPVSVNVLVRIDRVDSIHSELDILCDKMLAIRKKSAEYQTLNAKRTALSAELDDETNTYNDEAIKKQLAKLDKDEEKLLANLPEYVALEKKVDKLHEERERLINHKTDDEEEKQGNKSEFNSRYIFPYRHLEANLDASKRLTIVLTECEKHKKMPLMRDLILFIQAIPEIEHSESLVVKVTHIARAIVPDTRSRFSRKVTNPIEDLQVELEIEPAMRKHKEITSTNDLIRALDTLVLQKMNQRTAVRNVSKAKMG